MTTHHWTKSRENEPALHVRYTEVEPGIVHITTDAIAELLEMAGFQEADADTALQLLREIFSNGQEETS